MRNTIGRLAVALLVGVLMPLSSQAREGHTIEGNWFVEFTESIIDDSQEVFATNLPLDQEIENPDIILAVRCKNNKTDLAFTIRGYLGTSSSVRVIYRINSEKAVESRWTPSTTGRGAFFQGSPIAMLRSLPVDGTFALRVFVFDGSYKEAKFDLQGLDKVLGYVAESCEWPPE